MGRAKRLSVPSRWDIDHRPLLVPTVGPRYVTHQVLPHVFTPRECQSIIDLGTRSPADEATVQDGNHDESDPSLRQAQITWLAPTETTAWVIERLAAVAERANEIYGFELTGFSEDLQFTTYDTAGSFYTWHQDGLDGAVAGRKLSLVIQLSASSDYDGSDLEFLEVQEDYADDEAGDWRRSVRRRGTAVAFPAFEYHRVTPLLSGTRHSLVCWISGPPFR
jgi:PKHD-type hydroxylase